MGGARRRGEGGGHPNQECCDYGKIEIQQEKKNPDVLNEPV